MTGQQFARLWTTRVQRYGPAMRNELRLIGQRAIQLSRAHLEADIYARPVDTRPRSGRPAWRRTGALLAGEGLESDSQDSFSLVNDVSYAEYRHEAGKPGRRVTKRPAHWRDETVKELQAEMPERLHALQVRILSGGS